FSRDWSSDVCSSDLNPATRLFVGKPSTESIDQMPIIGHGISWKKIGMRPVGAEHGPFGAGVHQRSSKRFHIVVAGRPRIGTPIRSEERRVGKESCRQ